MSDFKMYFLSTVRSAGLHMALLSVRPHFSPHHHGNQQDLQAAAGQGRLPREKPALLLEAEEAGETGKDGGREEKDGRAAESDQRRSDTEGERTTAASA